MTNVFGISQRAVETTVSPIDAESRAAFVKDVQEFLDLYAKGQIDVICFGFVDNNGVPASEVGPFPDGLANDVLALGLDMKRSAKAECRSAHDRVQNEA